MFVYLGCFITPEQIAASSSIIGFKFSKWPFILNSMTSNINGAFFTTLNVTANIFMERLCYVEIQVKEQASEEDAQADIHWYRPDNNHALSINFNQTYSLLSERKESRGWNSNRLIATAVNRKWLWDIWHWDYGLKVFLILWGFRIAALQSPEERQDYKQGHSTSTAVCRVWVGRYKSK